MSERYPTVDVRVDVEDTAVVAGLARALVMTALEQLAAPAPGIPVELLRAAVGGVQARSVGNAATGTTGARRPGCAGPARARGAGGIGDVEFGADGLARLRRDGTGADRQRRAWNSGGPAAVLRAVAISS